MIPRRVTKSGWHLLLVALALAEFTGSRTNLRKFALGCAAGWHVYAAYDDFVRPD